LQPVRLFRGIRLTNKNLRCCQRLKLMKCKYTLIYYEIVLQEFSFLGLKSNILELRLMSSAESIVHSICNFHLDNYIGFSMLAEGLLKMVSNAEICIRYPSWRFSAKSLQQNWSTSFGHFGAVLNQRWFVNIFWIC
jgi:hypothetical protein